MTESRIDDGLGAFVEICSGINSNEDDAMVYKDLGEFYFLTESFCVYIKFNFIS